MEQNVFDIKEGRRSLILGDSLVAGQGADRNNGWAQQFAAVINADVIGVRGATSKDILTHLPDRPYTHVFVQIGTNDARFRHLKNATECSCKQYAANLSAIVQHFRELNPDVELSFIDLLVVDEQRTVLYRADRSYFEKNLQEIRNTLSDFCMKNDLNLFSLETLEKNKEDFPDGLHPGQKIHDTIAKLVATSAQFGEIE